MATDKQRERVLILGAAGRDFHTFNVCFRDDPNYQVVAFTAAQIPGIESRRYPPSLSGSLYPDGIPIYAEEDLARLIPLDKPYCRVRYDLEKISRPNLTDVVTGFLSTHPINSKRR